MPSQKLNYLRRLGFWVWQGKFHIFTISTIIVTTLHLCRVINIHPAVSSIMSLLGLFIILIILMLDAEQYAEQYPDKKPNTILNWLKSCPKLKLGVIFATGNITLEAVSVSSRGRVSPVENANIDEKVDYLLHQVNYCQDLIEIINGRIDNLETSSTKMSNSLNNDIKKLDNSLTTKIADHIIGDYDITLFGITLTVCGSLIQFFYSFSI